MKQLLTLFGTLLLLGGLVAPLHAQDAAEDATAEAETEQTAEEQKPEVISIPDLL